LPFQLQVESFWLGATDNVKEGSWIWQSSGKTATYTNWADGEPNNCCGGENCLVMYTSQGKWNDGTCPSSISIMCEFTFAC